MIVPNLADPFTASAVKAVQEVARARGYVVILTSSDGVEEIEKEELESLIRRQVDGLIVAPAIGTSKALRAFVASGIPLVVFDQPVRDANVDSVLVDNRAASCGAVKHLIAHGYKRILAVGARPGLYTCAERLAGYQSAVDQEKLPRVELLVEHEQELNSTAVEKLLGSRPAPDAIFALNYVTCTLMLRAIRDLGRQVGHDIPFASFDDFEFADMLPTSLTVVRQPSAEMGRTAAELLFRRLASHEKLSRKKIVLNTAFCVRRSCGCHAGPALPNVLKLT